MWSLLEILEAIEGHWLLIAMLTFSMSETDLIEMSKFIACAAHLLDLETVL